VVLYASNGFCLSNNNCTKQEARRRLRQWTELYDKHDVALEQVYVLSAFGCNFEGDVPLADVMEEVRHTVDLCREQGRALPRIDLDDSMGWADPHSIRQRVDAVREAYPELEIGLHLHDNRGLGGACAVVDANVTRSAHVRCSSSGRHLQCQSHVGGCCPPITRPDVGQPPSCGAWCDGRVG